ncbi:rRNA processing/ribosome biogenesis-domain-containing protein [Morchella snyderi]|nr:rRNA processing/ribosome biogenesis-domain-containing protein [Morchella snyderi]
MPPPPSKRSSKGEDSIGALRTITSLLSTSDPAVLPTHIPTIVSLLYSSSVLESCHALANAQQKKKSSEDAGVLLHKYKTRISALLQSKTAQSRWCGAALVKASVESSWECLAGHGSVWIRLLVPLLARPEPTATHRVVIATLSRVFTALTEGKPTLVREMVVPNLPATIGHLLAATESENELLAVVLEALRDILQAHPVTFRPFAQKTYTLVLNVLSSTNSTYSAEERLAREIFALLHLCASGSSSRGVTNNADGSSSSGGNNKATAVADEWTRGFRAVIEDTHVTLNTLFRCVIEDSDYGSQRSDGKKELTSEAHGTSTLGLSDWKGLTDGVERVSVLLRQLQSFFTLPSTAQVTIPIGQLVDLTTRIFSISPSSAQINQAVERSEREFVFARLSELQRGALNLLSTVLARLGSLFIPFALMLIDQIAYVFAEQGWNSEVKMAIYTLLNALLETFGSGLPKPSVHVLHPILSSTCDDLLPPTPPAAAPTTTTTATTAPPKGGIRKPKNSTANGAAGQNFHADAFLSVLPTSGRFVYLGLVAAAETLLATALARLPTACVRSELRTKMDRTAVLTGNTEAMLASVLFPPLGARRGGAVLPHLVGAGSKKALVIEGVVRPRLPVIWTGKRKAGEEEDDEMEIAEEQPEDDDDEEDSEEENEEESIGPLAFYSKKPYPVEMEATSDESPFKRQKTEAMDSTMQGTIAARKPSLLDDMILAQAAALAQSSAAAAALVPEPLLQASAPQQHSITAASSSSFVSTTVVSSETHAETTQQQKKTTTTTIEKSRDFTEGGESDDDMVIPEIVMGGDSSEDEDDDEE